MPIELTCPQCGQRLLVPRLSEGEQARCPRCGEMLHGNATVFDANEKWRVRTDDGRDYGPVSKSDLDQWCAEGKLNQLCQVRRHDAENWLSAASLYPGLSAQVAAAPIRNPSAPQSAAAARGIPFRTEYGASPRSKVVAGILGITLGQFGVHRFYLGFVGVGLVQLLLTLLTCGASWLWGPIEGILILAGVMDRDAEGRLLHD